MPGPLLRRQKQRTPASECAPPWMPPPSGTTLREPRRPALCIGKTPPARPPAPTERVSSPAIDRSGCCWCGGTATRTSLRRIAMAASAVIAVGAATAALPDTVGAGAGSAGASRLVLRSASVPPTTVGTMAARIPPTGGRLRHAPPLGDQPLGSSRLAVDSRLLLGVPF